VPIADDPFATLGLGHGASEKEIRAAYRRVSKSAHPDQGGSAEAFRRVREAAEILLAQAGQRVASAAAEGAYALGDRTSAEGEWFKVSDAAKARWGMAFEPATVFAPQKIGLSPFCAGPSLNLPAYRWLVRNVGQRGEAWDFHTAHDVTRMFFRHPDHARQFQLRFH
jgi:hypothetical protein